MKLLHIDASALGGHSVSRSLTQSIVAELTRAEPGHSVPATEMRTATPTITKVRTLTAFGRPPRPIRSIHDRRTRGWAVFGAVTSSPSSRAALADARASAVEEAGGGEWSFSTPPSAQGEGRFKPLGRKAKSIPMNATGVPEGRASLISQTNTLRSDRLPGSTGSDVVRRPGRRGRRKGRHPRY